MFNFFCLLTGDRAQTVDQFGSNSRKKISMMAMGLLAVVVTWASMSCLIGSQVLQLGTTHTVLLALVCTVLVFIVDRSIIQMPHRSWGIGALRLFIALIVALVGGTALDLVLLDGEIRQELVYMHEEQRAEMKRAIDLKYATAVQEAEHPVAQAQAAYDQAERDFKLEMNGAPQGTGLRGMGKVATEKKALWSARLQDLHNAQAVLVKLQGKRDGEVRVLMAKQEKASIQPALFERIHALHRYVRRDTAVFCGWLLFTLLIVFIELLPTMAKFLGKETAYERSQRLVEELHQRHLEHRAGMRQEEVDARSTLRAVQQEYAHMRRSA